MTLKENINREFDRLAAQGGSAAGQLTVTADVGRLQSAVLDSDSIGCTFSSFVLSSDKLAGASLQRLQQLSDSLSKKLTYLLEPISPIETDPDGCVVQLRSNPPHKDDDGTTYYELLVRRGGELSLCRWQKTSDAQRTSVPAHVTREVFHRLAADFVAVLS